MPAVHGLPVFLFAAGDYGKTQSVHTDSLYQLVRLNNGVCSVRSLADAETFHPVIGPVAEAEALYVRQLRLRERLKHHPAEFVIWDVGLGAAANALTVLRATRSLACRLRLVSFDHTLEPLKFAMQHAEDLGYFGGYEHHLGHLLRERRVEFKEGRQTVIWEFHLGDFPSLIARASAKLSPPPQAILFDAFSPAKNPAMWTLPLFRDVFRRLDPRRPCALTTYSRSTILRVTLLRAGFFVGVGHATGEKEETTIAANDLSLITEPLDRRWLERARRSHSAEPLTDALYHTAPLSAPTWEALRAHPQFQNAGTLNNSR